MHKFTDAIDRLAKSAARATDSSSALRYSQAALNLAHAEATSYETYKTTEIFKQKMIMQNVSNK